MFDTLLAGIIHGNAYALVAVGLSLIFGVSNVVNFAQGSVFAIGTMTGWWLIDHQHLPLWAAMVGVCLFTALIGLLINSVAVQPLGKAPPIAALLATYAARRGAARQMGIPVHRIQQISFMLASALGGLAGVLVGMYNSNISPASTTTAGLAAFTAATLGGLGSLPGAVLGGLVLGVLEAFGIYFWGAGVDDLITFGVLLLVLWVRPGGLLGKVPLLSTEPLTGTFLGRGRPIRLARWQVGALLVLAAVAVPLVATGYQLTAATQIIIYALLALSLTLVSGSAGQVALGQVGPLAVGAYASALLVTDARWPFLLALPVAGLTAAVVSGILMSPTWRLKGHYVSIASLGIGAVTVAAILNLGWLTHGALGVVAIPPPSILGFEIVTPLGLYILDLAVLLIAVGVVVRLQQSFLGKIWSAVGSDEVALSAAGVRPSDYKALAFAVGSCIAGLAGSLLAHQYSYIDPTLFTSDLSLLALTTIVLGAMNSAFGAILGALVLVGGPEFMRMTQDARLLSYGVLLLLLIRFRPHGLWARRA